MTQVPGTPRRRENEKRNYRHLVADEMIVCHISATRGRIMVLRRELVWSSMVHRRAVRAQARGRSALPPSFVVTHEYRITPDIVDNSLHLYISAERQTAERRAVKVKVPLSFHGLSSRAGGERPFRCDELNYN